MTTDPPPAEFEDVRIGNWQSRLPSAICANKEIFDEVFSLETWKAVLQPEQRDRILKLLPPEVLKIPGAAEKTIEDLFTKSLTSFSSNPLDTFYDTLCNGHYDPEVVETKSNIVRTWKRESLRLRKHYHTKLLQDIVISRDKQLRKFVPSSPVHKKNGKKSISTANNNNNGTTKKNGKGAATTPQTATTNGTPTTNGIPMEVGIKGKNGQQQQNNGNSKVESLPISAIPNSRNTSKSSSFPSDQNGSSKNNKRGRLEAALLSPPLSLKDGSSNSPISEGPSKKKSKNSSSSPSSSSKSKGGSNKKSKDNATIVSSTPSSQLAPLLLGNGPPSQKTSLLLGTLTAGSSPLEPPTLSLRSPSSLSGGTSTSSLLESLTSPIQPVSHLSSSTIVGNDTTIASGGGGGVGGGLSSKQYSKIFPSPVHSSSPVSTSQSPSFLQSPVQSSPILASQLQAPSPISVNLSAITGGGLSSRNDSIPGSPSQSSITLNYTQPPTPTTPTLPPPSSTITSGEGLMDNDSSSDEFEFEGIEPTIGFSGPSSSSLSKSSPSSNLKSSTMSSSVGYSISSSNIKKLSGTVSSSSEISNVQKCSLLTNCLTSPLSSNSSSNAAVSAALANNILTSTPVPESATMTLHSGGGSPTVQQLIQHHPQQSQPKIIVSSSGIMTSSASLHHQQQLQKFLSASLSSSSTATINTATQKLIAQQQQQQPIGIFQQQSSSPQKNVIPASSSAGPVAMDAQTLVNTLMAANSKDLLSAFNSSMGGGGSGVHQMQIQSVPQHATASTANSTVLPISVTMQNVQDQQLKQATFIRTNSGSLVSSLQGGIPHQQQQQAPHQQLLTLQPNHSTAQPIVVVGQGSSLNTQSLQLPSSILASSSNSSGNISNKIGTVPTATTTTSASIPNLLDSDDLNLGLGSFSLGGMNLDLGGGNLSEMDSGGMGSVDGIKLEMDCGMDKMDDLSGVLDGNPFDSIPNLSDELDGLDLDMVDGLCDFEILLSEEKQHASFFSLIRDVLCSTRDHRMTLVVLEKTIKKWTSSSAASLNPWFMRVQDWNMALIVALNFLAGNYQDVHPEDFVPYIEYKYKTKYYQWIGAGRDGDNNLSPLCCLWLDNLDKLPPLRKTEVDGDEPEEEEDENEDSDTGMSGDPSEPKKKNKRPQTPPPPRCTTEWSVRPSTDTEKEEFRRQEKNRFENPHKAFTYRMHGYESVVGPVKGVYSSQTGITNKARGHSLLVDDRPPYVTILALVRDAVARLPNGEGTRSEICEMLRDSAFLAPEASNVTLNSVVSGALDRLHYERDPCVRYDSHKKSWIYLHRDRSQEQFERLHHNRSYTKSTKSRNSSNRKARKGSKSSSSSSLAAAGAGTSSSSSSQCSTSAILESGQNSTTVATVIGVGNALGNVTSTASNTAVTLPPLSTMNPKIKNQLATLVATPGGITSVGQQSGGKPTIGIVSMTNSAQQQASGLAGALQQSLNANRGGIVSIQDAGSQQTQQQTQSLNDVLAAATGFRFQSNTGGPVVLNQNMVLGAAGQQQGKLQQATLIQEPGGVGTTARLVLQQGQQPGTLSATMQQASQNQGGVGIQVQSQQQQGPGGQGPTSIGPGQILLGSSAAAVLKLAGNIRGLEGLRLAQLRLPTTSTGQLGETASLASANGSPLRLPQHRILLARGTLPGQSQTQGVLLGQTSTGQTVILSAGPAGSNPLAGLQQALAASGATGGQIALHAAPQTIQLDSSSQSPVTLSGQQQLSQQQSLQTFSTGQQNGSTGPPKYGILTQQGGNSTVVVSSSSQMIQGNFSAVTRMQQSSSTSTLPSTSISLPASLLAPSSSTTGAVTVQSSPNITVSTSQFPPQHQQLILSSSGNHGQQGQQLGTIGGGGMQQQQSIILQQAQQQNMSSSSGQLQQQSQLGAPIIIRSAQGDFVSFGIPSHLSLGRGMQGIKVIPFQAGKQTVLARIVAPPTTSSATPSTSTSVTLSLPSSVSSSSSNIPISTIAYTTSSSILQNTNPPPPIPVTINTLLTSPSPPTSGVSVTQPNMPYVQNNEPPSSPMTTSTVTTATTTIQAVESNQSSSNNSTAIAPMSTITPSNTSSS